MDSTTNTSVTAHSTNTSSPLQSVDVAVNSYPWSATSVISLIIGCVGLITNLFVCVVFMRHEPLKKRLPNYFLLNQSVLDLVAGLVLMVTKLVAVYVTTRDHPVLIITCYLIKSQLIFLGLFMASVWNLAALSFERYMEIVHPIRHKLWLTSTKVLVTCVAVWIFGIISKCLVITPVVKLYNGQCIAGNYVSLAARRISGIYIISTEFLIPLCIIAWCYVKMWRAVRKITSAPSTSGDTKSQMVRARQNIVKLLAIISIAFVITVAPRHLAVLSSTMGALSLDPNGPLFSACLIVNYLNCCINPLLYMFKYEEFQKGVRAIFGKKASTIVVTTTRRENVF